MGAGPYLYDSMVCISSSRETANFFLAENGNLN